MTLENTREKAQQIRDPQFYDTLNRVNVTKNTRRACVIVNLGSPEKPEIPEIRKFIKSFLSDPKVIQLPKWIWYPILHGMVITFRPKKIAHNYKKIWTPNGSPIICHTQNQAKLIQEALPEVEIYHAFSYVEPYLDKVLERIAIDGTQDVTVLPLYPHYAPSTVGSVKAVVDKIEKRLNSIGNPVKMRVVMSWYKSPQYIQWYATSLKTLLEEQSGANALVFSYHSLPNTAGHGAKEYKKQCRSTTDAILSRLQAMEVKVPEVYQTYQSKFGPGEWIGPSTIDTMEKLGKQKIEKLLVCTPGFISDCIETVDEIGVINRDEFLSAGGKNFTVLPPMNSNQAVGEVLKEIYQANLLNPLSLP